MVKFTKLGGLMWCGVHMLLSFREVVVVVVVVMVVAVEN